MKKQYQIISPDGFTIDREPYKSLKEAKKAFIAFLTRFEAQGYYSTIENGKRLQIPLEDIESYCELQII